MAGQQAREVVVVQLVQELAEALAASQVDLAEYVEAGLGWVDLDDPAVSATVPSLDQAALLHAIHDAGHARDRDVEGLRKVAHRIRPVSVEEGQHVQVDEA